MFDITRTKKRPSAQRLARYHTYLRNHGGNKPFFWICYAVIGSAIVVFIRLQRDGRRRIPRSGAGVLAANHTSFFDVFWLALLARRRVFFVAKAELFHNPLVGWIFTRLGAIPILRGDADTEAIETAHSILERGELVGIFPEGTRVKEGKERRPKSGAARLAADAGVPLVPCAIAASGHGEFAIVAGDAMEPTDDVGELRDRSWEEVVRLQQQAADLVQPRALPAGD